MEISPELSQNLFGFVSGLIGAAVGGWFTLYATKQQERAQIAARQHAEQQDIFQMLSSLGVELNALWEFHQKRIGEFIESLPEGEPCLFYYPLTQNYFIIYDTNAPKIGALDDTELRKAIVMTYNKCKKVVDGFVYNNTLFADYRNQIIMSDDSPSDTARIEAKLAELKDFAKYIKSDHYEVKEYVENLFALLEKRNITVTFYL